MTESSLAPALETLARISKVLTAGELDTRGTARSVAEIISEVLACECTITVLSKDGQWLDVVARTSQSPATLELVEGVPRFSAHTGNPGEALRTRTAVLAQQDEIARQMQTIADPELRRVVEQYAPSSVLVVPLIESDAPIGVLVATRGKEARPFTDEHRALAVVVSPIIALYLALAARRAEAASAHNRLATIADAIPALVSFVDRDERYQYVNATYERWFDVPREKIIGSSLRDVLGEAYPTAEPFVTKAFAGETVRFRRQLAYPSGARHVDAQYVPVTGAAGVEGMAVLVQDVSAEVRIAEFERGRQLVAEASAMFARSLDLDKTLGDVVRLPLAVGLADWCCVDLLGEDSALQRVELASGDTAEPMRRRLTHDAARAGASAAITSARPQLAVDLDDGARSRLSVPLLHGERVLGAISISSRARNFDDLDISIATDLARHAAIAIENARLFEAASRARREAEDANRAKDQFLAMLGHELRNPLAPLVTALDLMRMRSPDVLVRERAVIQRQVQHLVRLVDDLLDISRITRGKVELRRERVTLETIVQRAIEQVSPLLEQQQHNLSLDIAPDVRVDGDPVRLAQVVANLLSNAAKYSKRNGQIVVRAEAVRGEGVVTVRDKGIGIGPEMLPHIFDLFVQAPQPSARQDGGLGLGLTIVKKLVEMHGGSITAHSDGVDRGAEFTLRLPLAGPSAAAAAEERTAAPGRPRVARRILVVDDNEDAAKLLAEILDAYGHDIRTAADGPSALRIADDFRPEIAVLDLGLPVMDGYELAERLAAQPEHASVRLIALTGYGQDSDRARSRHAGFEAHLSKPVAIETLVQLVNEE